MVRALVAALALILGMGACDSSTTDGTHWPHGTDETVVWLMVAPGSDYWQARDAAAWAARVWSEDSPYVEVRSLAPAHCSDYPWESRCVDVYVGEAPQVYGWAAMTQLGVDTNHHIHTGTSTWIIFDSTMITQPWPGTFRRAVACHETGHALGLQHGDTWGPCDQNTGRPTPVDLSNVATAYGHVD